jgi:hypothetical protein
MAIRQDRVTFLVLVAAFGISALYQLYRAMLLEVPRFDAFTLMMGAAYTVLLGISALVLTNRRWAWWTVSGLVLFLLAVSVFWYYPLVAAARMDAGSMGLVGWLEGIVYTGLLFVAGFNCALNLLGARLVPGRV